MNDEAFDCKCPDVTPAKGNGLVYVYTLDNGMQYIGQTTRCIKKRHDAHRERNEIIFDIDLKCHKWHLAIIGEYPIEMLSHKENLFIQTFDTLHPIGYNNVVIIDGIYHYSELAKTNIKECIKALANKPITEETRKKLSDCKMGNTWNRGRIVSEEGRVRRSNDMKKLWADPVFKAKRRIAIKNSWIKRKEEPQ